ncbi:hypothetical protein [Haloarcula salina]|uniref:Uncharacterized protein n=1 Tax=Haloarcula salina TaxID=1429914 RepID=A0AA41G1Z6_9EURY|nr:hypothetical protein [Haloarcula salina]MBV0902039.1 hypothetical protein [Haloarcula salina]
MSSASPFRSPTEAAPRNVDLQSLAVRPLRFVAFWLAILAPLAYPPLLLGGLDSQTFLVFVGVVALNVFGLLAGRGYGDRA